MTIREACELWVSRDMNAIPQSVLVKLKQLDPDDIAELTPITKADRVYVCSAGDSNSRGLESFLEADEGDMDVIRTLEPIVNRYQMAAEEAAELAQAMLKYCRVSGHGSHTPMNPKDATDAVIEEYADLLLAMEASFPRYEGNKMFYNNLERVYREKAKRWAERLKEHDN